MEKNCAKIGIPSWIVDVRHESVHNSLPSLETLKLAAEFLLTFLEEKYWKKQTIKLNKITENINNTLNNYEIDYSTDNLILISSLVTCSVVSFSFIPLLVSPHISLNRQHGFILFYYLFYYYYYY